MRCMKVCAVQVDSCYCNDFKKLVLNAAEMRGEKSG
jgi:hypothetical protein